MIYQNHFGVIIIFAKFSRIGGSKKLYQIIIIVRIGDKKFQFRQRFFSFQNSS